MVILRHLQSTFLLYELFITAMNWWFSVFPGPGLFQLSCQPEKRGLIPETAGELNPDRCVVLIPE